MWKASLTIDSPPAGGIASVAGGQVTYTPNTNFHGRDSFTYRAHDGELASNVATVVIDVAPVNDVPVAVDDAYSVQEDGRLLLRDQTVPG